MGNSQSHTSEPFIWYCEEMYATFEDDWFDQGASTYAYSGRIKPTNRWSFKRGEQCIVKLYKEEYCPRLKEEAWRADNRASLKTKEMAEQFNHKYNDRGIASIEVLIPIISKVKTFATSKLQGSYPVPKKVRGANGVDTETADAMVRVGAAVAIEHFLQGRYVQFLSNSAYVNPEEDTLVPEAFSHFTYHASEGEILVTDLQGVHNQKSYVFTNPAIHSTEKHGTTFGNYGPTDLGVYGVMRFFLDHICNHLCRALLTPDTSGIPIYMRKDLIKVIEAIKARSCSTSIDELVIQSGLTADELQKAAHQYCCSAYAECFSDSANGKRVHEFGLESYREPVATFTQIRTP